MTRLPKRPSFAVLVQDFFCDRLIQQQNLSAHTVASYRDTFRLLLHYCQKRQRKGPAKLTLEDLDAPSFWRSWMIWSEPARTLFAHAIRALRHCVPS